jgi:hypothetical protein
MKHLAAITLCSLLGTSCAATMRSSTQSSEEDRQAVAHAVVFVIFLAPAAREYAVQLESPFGTAVVLKRISELADVRVSGHSLQGRADAPVSKVALRANRPRWAPYHGLRSATVAVAYVAGQDAGACDIRVLPPQSSDGTAVPDWSMTAASGVPCWPKR